MLFQPRSITPDIIKVVPPPTKDVSVVGVILDALGLVGLITVAAILTGLALGAGLIWYKRWRERVAPESRDAGTRLNLSTHGAPPKDTNVTPT